MPKPVRSGSNPAPAAPTSAASSPATPAPPQPVASSTPAESAPPAHALSEQDKARLKGARHLSKRIPEMNLKTRLNEGLIEKQYGKEVAADFKKVNRESTDELKALMDKQSKGPLEINEANKLDRLKMLNQALQKEPMKIAKAISENRSDPAYQIMGPTHFAAMEVVTRQRLETKGKGDYGLSTMERVCIYGYTTKDYKTLNPELRKAQGGNLSDPRVKSYSDHITSGLKKLPEYAPEPGKDQNLYRGMMMSDLPDHIKSQIKPGGVLKDYAFLSTSVDRDAASSAGNIQLNIQSFAGKGAKLLPFSAFDGEGEVLFPPGVELHLQKLAPYSQVRYEVLVH